MQTLSYLNPFFRSLVSVKHIEKAVEIGDEKEVNRLEKIGKNIDIRLPRVQKFCPLDSNYKPFYAKPMLLSSGYSLGRPLIKFDQYETLFTLTKKVYNASQIYLPVTFPIQGWNQLPLVFRAGSTSVLDSLLSNSNDFTNLKCSRGLGLLHHFLLQPEMLKVAINKGLPIDGRDICQYSPFELALRMYDESVSSRNINEKTNQSLSQSIQILIENNAIPGTTRDNLSIFSSQWFLGNSHQSCSMINCILSFGGSIHQQNVISFQTPKTPRNGDIYRPVESIHLTENEKENPLNTLLANVYLVEHFYEYHDSYAGEYVINNPISRMVYGSKQYLVYMMMLFGAKNPAPLMIDTILKTHNVDSDTWQNWQEKRLAAASIGELDLEQVTQDSKQSLAAGFINDVVLPELHQLIENCENLDQEKSNVLFSLELLSKNKFTKPIINAILNNKINLVKQTIAKLLDIPKKNADAKLSSLDLAPKVNAWQRDYKTLEESELEIEINHRLNNGVNEDVNQARLRFIPYFNSINATQLVDRLIGKQVTWAQLPKAASSISQPITESALEIDAYFIVYYDHNNLVDPNLSQTLMNTLSKHVQSKRATYLDYKNFILASKNQIHLENYRDTLIKYMDRVVVSALVRALFKNENLTDAQRNEYEISKFQKRALEVFSSKLFQNADIRDLASFSKAGHSEATTNRLQKHFDYGNSSWEPLFNELSVPQSQTNRKSIMIVALSSNAALKEESDRLKHCVGTGGYVEECYRNRTHILSIRDSKNKPLSTIELVADYNNKTYSIAQHRGHSNGDPCNASKKALVWLKDQIAKKEIVIDYAALQQKRDARVALTHSLQVKAINFLGFDPLDDQTFYDVQEVCGKSLPEAGPLVKNHQAILENLDAWAQAEILNHTNGRGLR